MSRRRVLVTGAAGRVGSVLCPALETRNWDLTKVDLAGGDDVIAVDCLDVARMTELAEGCHGIIHLAAVPNADLGWAALMRINVEGTRAALEAARRAGVRSFVFASSIHTVGALPAATPITATLGAAPSGLYGASKLAAEALVSAYALKAGLAAVIVRICTFASEPRNARELKTWFAPSDAAQLFDLSLRAEHSGTVTVWGVSENERAGRYDPAASVLGYRPNCNGEDHAERLARAGVDVSGLGQWATLGGRMTDADDLGVLP